MQLYEFVKANRKAAKLTQPELAAKAGEGLRFIRELEQGRFTGSWVILGLTASAPMTGRLSLNILRVELMPENKKP
jgi:transcriptional regulator with XRE-family HTH domain